MHMNTYPVCEMRRKLSSFYCLVLVCWEQLSWLCYGLNSLSKNEAFPVAFPIFPFSCIEHFSHHSQIPFSLLSDIGSLHSILFLFFGSLTLFTHASQIFFILFKPFSLPGTGELKGKLHNKSAFNFIFSDFFSVRHSQKKDDTKKFATRPNWNVNTTETRKWAKFCSWREEKRGKSRKIRRVSMCGWREENERKCREWCINI